MKSDPNTYSNIPNTTKNSIESIIKRNHHHNKDSIKLNPPNKKHNQNYVYQKRESNTKEDNKMSIQLIKNIMKTRRKNGSNQYTISLPNIIQQVLEIPENKTIYLHNRSPGNFQITTQNKNHKEQSKRSIFPNGNSQYFTLPTKYLKDIDDERINHATFNIDFEHVDETTNKRGIITLTID